MKDSLIGNAKKRGGQEYCSHCREPIPAGAAFCPHCGPPNIPEEEPDEGIGFGQTFFRIFLIVALFSALAIFKLDLQLWDSREEAPVEEGPVMKSKSGKKVAKPHAVDFTTSHHIKADQSKVREKPSNDGKTLTVLKKGAKVTILEGNEDWWKITGGGKVGWIIKDDLDTEIK
ncbi:MAG: hypothetical protein NPINA01_12690 [Nitrospinaceae bacterium]|nr:MAG: hypothetical protein NPINA01_12690 [Nitrospinaceae bacterium]